MAVSKTAFTLLVTMDMVLLLISICLHCFGVYLLLFRRKTRKNQHVILIHLSVSEILVSGFRTVTLVYFHQYEKQEELLVYQVLRTITIQGWCVSYVLIMIAVAVDPLLMIVLKTKYNRLVSRRRLNITLASCWVVGVLYGAVSFTQDYKTREEIAAKYTFPIICACFLLFAGGAYCVIYISVRKGYKQMRRRTLTHTNNRTVKFRVPVLIILTFIVFVALPSGIVSNKSGNRKVASDRSCYFIFHSVCIRRIDLFISATNHETIDFHKDKSSEDTCGRLQSHAFSGRSSSVRSPP